MRLENEHYEPIDDLIDYKMEHVLTDREQELFAEAALQSHAYLGHPDVQREIVRLALVELEIENQQTISQDTQQQVGPSEHAKTVFVVVRSNTLTGEELSPV